MKSSEAIHLADKKYIVSLKEELGEYDVEVKKENLIELLSFFKGLSYCVLMDLTAVDYLEPEKTTKLIYWLHNPNSYERIRVVLFVPRGGKVPSVTPLFQGANWYERELYDMFGISFEAHPDLKRILMPDDWVGHPMLRDYALTEEPVQFKHGVQPKVPSQIIPNVKLKVIV